MEIIHLGGEHTVTGSCHLLQTNGLNIMVDCGMSQGHDRVVSMDAWPVKPSDIHYLFLTHAHLDHIGRVPELIEKGFNGEIIVTHGTKALLAPMLRDAMTFSHMDETRAREILSAIDDFSWGFEYNQSFSLKKGIGFKLGRAGHILGSCWVRFDFPDGSSVVFSGDLGAKDTPILPDPDIPDSCDLLVLESTYGDRLHEDRKQRIHRLGKLLTRALSDKGKIFIPAFALGRTQELIYEMDRLFSAPENRQMFPELNGKSPVPVFVDSPLGLEITKIYAGLSDYWDEETRNIHHKGDHPLDFNHLYGVKGYRDHLKLLEIPGPAIIIAGSGMCTGGRIVDHLKAGIDDPRNDILFVGYQSAGTPGRAMIRNSRKAAGRVKLEGQRFPIRAQVHTLTGYSAHADQKELLEWAKAIQPQRIKLVHGEPEVQEILRNMLR